MRLTIFASRDSQAARRLLNAPWVREWAGELVFCQTPGELDRALCRPYPGLTATVALVADGEEIASLGHLTELRYKLSLILVLPDREPATVRLGHSLQPRFMTYSDVDPDQISQVLERLRVKEASHA
jgi:hypothetical protein